ncbi:hypothetical protein ACQEU5_21420 [Marinactinospora thermotolerans]|uniref:Uncharacterized protein n=1 Tax=Marinactinospora thermotolerans DSM 45154 TaxID=1122192 RepID=A0A1T4PEA9_9ACTN|nr:hypothetical protein [Marinactinospora thermotolerans]SJZ89913.1 hypothetical protein SAMN02745673_01773 [Marinactinospora thermotolerans DSM 45154]
MADMTDDYVSIRLRGGPPYWAGKSLDKVYNRNEIEGVPLDELGVMLLVPDGVGVPEQPEGEDENPRALYGPESEDDRYTWVFQGFLPTSASDPGAAFQGG